MRIDYIEDLKSLLDEVNMESRESMELFDEIVDILTDKRTDEEFIVDILNYLNAYTDLYEDTYCSDDFEGTDIFMDRFIVDGDNTRLVSLTKNPFTREELASIFNDAKSASNMSEAMSIVACNFPEELDASYGNFEDRDFGSTYSEANVY